MKRTVPLLITAIAGFILIFSAFIPATESWGEEAAIWFDVLAAIAFVLGGGNLLKVHLKKTSDRAPGWGYSVVTLLAFLTMLFVGLTKFGSPPAVIQEYYGETFAELPLSAFPDSQVATISASIPDKENHEPLAASVGTQTTEDEAANTISFRGWMRANQRDDLQAFKNELEWKCQVDQLFKEAAPPEPFVIDAGAGAYRVNYYADHEALSFRGTMSPEQKAALLNMSSDTLWTHAVNELYNQSQRVTEMRVESWPDEVEIPENLKSVLKYDPSTQILSLTGPLSSRQRDALGGAAQFPLARPLSGPQRSELWKEVESRGSALNGEQAAAFNKTLDGSWTVQQLRIALDEAGKGQKTSKTSCEMLAEQRGGSTDIDPKNPAPPDVSLNSAQVALLEQFATQPAMSLSDLSTQLAAAGAFHVNQAAALDSFFAKQPTIGQRNKALATAMLRKGPLDQAQRDFLLNDYRAQTQWRRLAGDLFVAAHATKYPWSGSYRAQGNAFWWLYEYAFKPLTATMFAMLAFYVASAAFRAFRAKNLEASLLLGTAFIILLGRTFAGVWLTSGVPEAVEGLKLENLTVYIMSIFNTAGNRAIMIGIALGIASTSLKVLLGVDRSYLGKE